MNKYLLYVASLFLTLSLDSFAQDIHFSQHNLTQMLVNPAQAGAYKNPEVVVNYRTRNTLMFTYTNGRLMQYKWKANKWLATGFNVFNDKADNGKMGTTQVLASLGYHTTRLSIESTLGGALFGGYAQRGKSGYPDVGLGFLYQYRQMQPNRNLPRYIPLITTVSNVHVGFAFFHINSPQYSYVPGVNKLHMKMVGHADAQVRIKNTNFSLIPGGTYMQQDSFQEIHTGIFFRYMFPQEPKFSFVKDAAISVGTHFRVNTINKDAFIPSLQFELVGCTIGLSYDINISDSTTATSGKGGFEIHLRYRWPDLPLSRAFFAPPQIDKVNDL